jgi:hypothetical protein
MDHDQNGGISIFLVFGIIVIGAIALFSRIREQRSSKTTQTPPRDPNEAGDEDAVPRPRDP